MKKLVLIIFLIKSSLWANQIDLKWESLKKISNPNNKDIQEACQPRKISADTSVAKRGAIVLLHGFSACPQQYFELANDYLSKLGYDVYLPLLPGHGRVLKSNDSIKVRVTPTDEWYEAPVTDDLEDLFTVKNSKKVLSDFAKAINNMMKNAEGERIIGGLSGGSAISIKALALEPKLYDKAVIMNAFIKVSNKVDGQGAIGKVASQVVWLMGATGLWLENKGSWKDACEFDGREVGRAGYCQFTNNSISGLQKFGVNAFRHLKKEAANLSTNVQFVMVEEDKSVSNKHIIKLYKKLKKTNANVDICAYRKGANHEIISRFEFPYEDKFWLDSLLNSYEEFIDSGENFIKGERSLLEKGISRCRL